MSRKALRAEDMDCRVLIEDRGVKNRRNVLGVIEGGFLGLSERPPDDAGPHGEEDATAVI